MSRSREPLTDNEKQQVDALVQEYLTPKVHPLGQSPRTVSRYDKRTSMYDGTGVVYLLQLFRPDELVNNRIAAYMVLPTDKDSVGFHSHGDRNEEELYVVMQGTGIYLEKDTADSEPRSIDIGPGSVTSVKGEALHAVQNTGSAPLIVFVITTNAPV
jgi:mannose-6-phosphate isomerase-like protein (cupin superfamily)